MHMANELLSVPVAAGTLAIAAAGLGLVCRKAKQLVTSEKLALMGILGAFIFAAQMVNCAAVYHIGAAPWGNSD